MAEQLYTPADVELCIKAVDQIWRDGDNTDERFARAVLDALAAAGRLNPPPGERQFPIGTRLDALLPDGTHRYWSTHCRHDRHEDCSATTMTRDRVAGSSARAAPRPVEVHKTPAQCKTCASPCVCPCHREERNG